MTIVVDRRKVEIEPSGIIYAEAMDRKVVLHMQDRHITFYHRMSDLEKEVGEGFLRCHRSFLVNLDQMDHMEETDIIMKTGDNIPVPRQNRRYVRSLFAECQRERSKGISDKKTTAISA